MTTILNRYTGWCIDPQSPQYNGLIHSRWSFHVEQAATPNQLAGHEISAFKSRKEASDALPSVRAHFPKAKVIKVEITISPVGQE